MFHNENVYSSFWRGAILSPYSIDLVLTYKDKADYTLGFFFKSKVLNHIYQYVTCEQMMIKMIY